MNHRLLLFYFIFLFITKIHAQKLTVPDSILKELHSKTFFINNDTILFKIVYPLNYDSTKSYPVLLALSGGNQSAKIVDYCYAAWFKVLYNDLHKPSFEAYSGEIGLVYSELNHAIKNLKYWMKPESKPTPIALDPSTSTVYSQPLGVVLIISPWNYPFQLMFSPLVGAIAAGNCLVLKPSENTPHTANLIEKIVSETFDKNYISVVQGTGEEIGINLIKPYRFDHIFFTGSQPVGKKIMSMAAEHLTPVTLELGGKGPVIVDENVNLTVAAKRIAWAKCFNAGQTCIAPDYVLVHESHKDALIAKMKEFLPTFFNGNPLQSEHYAHIINEKRFNTLVSYLKDVNILHGGKYDAATRCIEPTIVDGVSENHPMAKEEIFGPILPIYTFKDIKEVVPFIRKNRYPLACYVFSKSKKNKQYIIDNVEFGGGCINNLLVQFANTDLPLGGCGTSGIGRYHGDYSFNTFSHKKSIISTATFIDPSLRYAPYNNLNNKIVKLILK